MDQDRQTHLAKEKAAFFRPDLQTTRRQGAHEEDYRFRSGSDREAPDAVLSSAAHPRAMGTRPRPMARDGNEPTRRDVISPLSFTPTRRPSLSGRLPPCRRRTSARHLRASLRDRRHDDRCPHGTKPVTIGRGLRSQREIAQLIRVARESRFTALSGPPQHALTVSAESFRHGSDRLQAPDARKAPECIPWLRDASRKPGAFNDRA
jgi:hypothetical protein